MSVSTDDSTKETKEVKTVKTVKKQTTVKTVSRRFCIAQSGIGDDPNYHLCRYKKDHEGPHKCCACKATW